MNYRTSFTTALLAISICRASAIELFETIRLSSGQYVSEVHGFLALQNATQHESRRYLLGSKSDAQGQNHAVIWGYDPGTGIVAEEVLPIPLGFQGGCNGGIEFADGDRAVVGNLTFGNTSMAVLWRRPTGGAWSLPEALFPGSPRSRLQAVDDRVDEAGHVVAIRSAGSVEISGVLRPVVVTTGEEDNVFALLPIPAGSQGEALGVFDRSSDTFSEVMTCGWFQMPGGVRKPCNWLLSGGISMFGAIPIPSNASGQANDVLRIDSGWVVCGGFSRSNRTRGFLYRNMDDISDGNFLQLAPLVGRDHAWALKLVDHPLQDDVFFVTGQSWNTGEPPVATVQSAIAASDPFVCQVGYAVEDLRYDGGDTGTHEIRSAEFRAGFAFGQCMDEEDFPFNSACLLLPTNTQVPDQLSLIAGRYGSGDFKGLWHLNDVGLSFAAKVVDREGSFKGLLVEVVFAPFSAVGGETYSATISARLAGSGANAGGTLNIYAVDPLLGTSTLASSHALTSADQSLTSALPGAASQWAHATTGRVKLRIELVTTGPARPTLVLDLVQLQLD